MMSRFAQKRFQTGLAGTYGLVLLMLAGNTGAATVIIGPGVGNGDFNDDVSATDSRAFDVTPNWWNLGTGADQAQIATRLDQAYDSTRNAIIASTGLRLHSQNTGYTIRAGDVFSISFVWRDSFQWDDANDRINIRLFVTDDDLIGGTQTQVVSFLSGLSTSDDTYEPATKITAPIPASFGGKTLMVAIDTDDGNADSNDFARVDNFLLQVTPDRPAPSMLIGPGVRNGDFNEDTATNLIRDFSFTPSWTNIGSGGEANFCTRLDATFDGSRRATIATGPGRIHAQDPNYTIRTGDVFTVSYYWLDWTDWDDAYDQIKIRFFVTDDDLIGGTQTELASFPSGLSQTNSTYEYVFAYTPPVAGSFAGKKLFVSIDSINGNDDDPEFAGLDDFTVIANPHTIPTLTEWGMIILFAGLGLLLVYRTCQQTASRRRVT